MNEAEIVLTRAGGKVRALEAAVKVATERDDPAHAKFSGLLIDRIEVVPVDLRGALEAVD